MANTEPNASPVGEAEAAGAWIGRVIDDRYRIVEVLGEGGMGAVFVAEHLKLRKLVALKTIRAEFSGDPQLEARFAREALATAQIDHPHVVSAVDFGHLPGGGAYLVIQLVRGVSLGRQLERGPLPWPQAAQLGAQVADALAAAHAAGIVHRDLKPDNILLESREGGMFAKVVDFGIARLSGETGAVVASNEPITRVGAVIGTPGYMAPEQAVGGQIDGRVDLYALGVILWESCTGRALWDADGITELFTRQLTTTPPALQGVPPALAALVAQLLATAPDRRPTSPALVRDELRAIARGEDVVAAMSHPTLSRASAATLPVARTVIANVMTGEHALQIPSLSPRDRAVLRRAGQIGAGVVLLLVLVMLGRRCGGDEQAPGDRHADERRAPAAAPTVAPVADAPAGEPGPASTYSAHAEVLLTETDRKARRAAAEAITGASEADKRSIPEYVRNLAWLEKNQSCEAKKLVFAKIEAADDSRVLPALRITADTPRNGCRQAFFRSDCLECLREDLARVIGRFEARAQATP